MAGRYLIMSQIDWSQDPGTSVDGIGWDDVTKVLIPRPQIPAISQNAGVSTIIISLPGPVPIGLVHVQRLNVGGGGPNSVIEVELGGGYDSGVVSAIPTDSNGPYPLQEWVALGMPRFFIPPAPVVTQVVQISVQGPAQVGYVGVCEIWQAPVNMSYDWSYSVIDLADIQRTPFGSTYVTKRGITRRINFGIDFLRQPGIYGEGSDDQIFSMLTGALGTGIVNGSSNPTAVCPLPDDTDNLSRTCIAGYASNAQFQNPFFATWNATFQVDQML